MTILQYRCVTFRSNARRKILGHNYCLNWMFYQLYFRRCQWLKLPKWLKNPEFRMSSLFRFEFKTKSFNFWSAFANAVNVYNRSLFLSLGFSKFYQNYFASLELNSTFGCFKSGFTIINCLHITAAINWL